MSRVGRGGAALALLGAVLLLTPLAQLLCANVALAQEDEKAEKKDRKRPDLKTKKVQALRKFAFEHLNAAHEAIATEDYTTALLQLDEMKAADRNNEHEAALMHQTYGYVYYQLDRTEDAIGEFKLALVGDQMSFAASQSTRFNLAQLLLLTDQLDEGIAVLEEWFDREDNPKPSHFIQLANAYVRKADYKKALPFAREGITRSDSPQESWLRLLVSLELKFEYYRRAIPVLELLLDRFPKKSYWRQLSAIYVEVEEEINSMTAYEMAYGMDFLDDEREFLRLANMYLYHEVPYKCGLLLEAEIESERIEGTEKNWELLGNCWIASQELSRSIEPLQKAAELSDDGNLWFRIGQVQLEKEKWQAAVSAFRKAIQKGELKHPGTTRLVLGIALFNDGDRGGAVKAFESAEKYDQVAKQAAQWLQHVERAEQTGTGF